MRSSYITMNIGSTIFVMVPSTDLVVGVIVLAAIVILIVTVSLSWVFMWCGQAESQLSDALCTAVCHDILVKLEQTMRASGPRSSKPNEL